MGYEIVRDEGLLRRFKKLGLVSFHEQTLKTVSWNGQKHTAYYVDDVPKWFELDGRSYQGKYFDGCFMPYVVKITN